MHKNKSLVGTHQSSTDKKKNVHFEFFAKAGSQVFVVGTFNNWNPTVNPLKDNPDSGHFKTVLQVPTGTYEYKFVVNDIWMEDPKCTESVTNIYGSLNNVLCV
jgi:1,4-alpha-glucan branching enzyme